MNDNLWTASTLQQSISPMRQIERMGHQLRTLIGTIWEGTSTTRRFPSTCARRASQCLHLGPLFHSTMVLFNQTI